MTIEISRPIGGYRKISTRQICLAWSAYRLGALRRYFDFRTYWALNEVDERQRIGGRLSKRKNKPLFNHDRFTSSVERDAATLLGGVSVRHVRGAISRLTRLGLVTLEHGCLSFPVVSDSIPEGIRTTAESMLKRIDARPRVRERTVPIPRRILRFLVGESSPALAATVFGHAIRCLWMNGRQCRGVGTCSVTFVSNLFEVHQRSVKRERARLLELGWLQRSVDEKRSGDRRPWFRVNLYWAEKAIRLLQPLPGAPVVRMGPERRVQSATLLSPSPRPRLIWINKPSLKTKYNDRSKVRGSTMHESPHTGLSKKALNAPNLRRVTLIDLQSIARLDVLHTQAAGARLVSGGSAGRLLVLCAAERALRVGTTNPCGLFVAIVRGGLWRHISQQDEDAALRRLAAESRKIEPFNRASRDSLGRDLDRRKNNATAVERRDRTPATLLELVQQLAELHSMDRPLTSPQNCHEVAIPHRRGAA